MSINQLISQGIAPVGRDIPQIANMLEQRKQAQQQNALAQMTAQTNQQNSLLQRAKFMAEMDETTKSQVSNALDNLESIADPKTYSQAVGAYANHPLAQQYGVKPEELTREGLPALRARLGIARPKPLDSEALEAVVGADGKPTLVPRSKAAGATPYYQPRASRGLKIQSDGAGGFSLYEGDGADGVALTKPTEGKLQATAVDAQAGIDRIAGIRQGFDPKWLTYTEQAKQFTNNIRQKAAGLPFMSKLKPDEEEALAAFSSFKADTLDNLNLYIKEITGAAMGAEEAKRIVATLPSLDDGPASFKSKLDRAEERMRLVLARSVYTQKKGIKFDAMPIEQMRGVINRRGDELARELKDPAAVRAALEAEFFR